MSALHFIPTAMLLLGVGAVPHDDLMNEVRRSLCM